VRVICRAGEGRAEQAAALYAEPDLAWTCAPVTPRQGDGRARAFGAWAVDRAMAWGADVVYARHFRAALASASAGVPTVLETHAYVGDAKPVLDEAFAATRDGGLRAISTISTRLAAHYVERGADPERVHVVPDGVDVELFTPGADLGEDPMSGRDRALYAGHLYDYKGIPTLLDAAALLPGAGVHLLGGTDEDVARVRSRVREMGLGNVHVHGPVSHASVPRWLWHADVLVLPPSGREASCAWTSPVKLGEYLASGVPIVASAIPALRDWVDESVVTWFEPDDAGSLATALESVLRAGPDEAGRARRAALAREFSYERRASTLLACAIETREVA